MYFMVSTFQSLIGTLYVLYECFIVHIVCCIVANSYVLVVVLYFIVYGSVSFVFENKVLSSIVYICSPHVFLLQV